MSCFKNLGVVAVLLLALAAPSKAMAQSPLGDAFEQWLTGHPNAYGQLQQNPYQVYDPDWRAQHPEVQRYINDNPAVWSGMRSRANLYYGQGLNRFLNDHPNLRSQLAANPDLIYDRRFRNQHPDLKQFLAENPNAWQKLARGPVGDPRGWGDYDSYHQWRDANWWHEHDRAWMYRHHPEWIENHPDWRDEDGDFDDAHVWHDRGWWSDHHRDWVERHHPNWFEHQQHDLWKEQEHAEHEEEKAQEHSEHEAFKDQQHAEHEAYKDQQHAEHEAYKAEEKHDKHGPDHGGPGKHDKD
jgi:hypothetical protein